MKKSVLLALGVVLVLVFVGAWWAWQRLSVQHEERSGLIRVSPAKTLTEGNPDDFVTVVFVLHNLSDQECTYELSTEVPQGWILLNELYTVSVAPQAQYEIFLTVQIPPGTPPGRYWLTLGAQSDPDFALGRTQITVRARERIKLALASSDLVVHPNEEKIVTLTVSNRGNTSARVTLAVTAAPVGWQFQLRESSMSLGPGESKIIGLIVKPLAHAELAPGRFTVQATSPSARDELSFTIALVP